jgi:hypothetical protein
MSDKNSLFEHEYSGYLKKNYPIVKSSTVIDFSIKRIF